MDRDREERQVWRLLQFHGMRHPREMGEGEIRAFLSPLATVAEVRAVLHQLQGTEHLVAQLLYGSGLELMEALPLRAQDVDLKARRQGGGG